VTTGGLSKVVAVGPGGGAEGGSWLWNYGFSDFFWGLIFEITRTIEKRRFESNSFKEKIHIETLKITLKLIFIHSNPHFLNESRRFIYELIKLKKK